MGTRLAREARGADPQVRSHPVVANRYHQFHAVNQAVEATFRVAGIQQGGATVPAAVRCPE